MKKGEKLFKFLASLTLRKFYGTVTIRFEAAMSRMLKPRHGKHGNTKTCRTRLRPLVNRARTAPLEGEVIGE